MSLFSRIFFLFSIVLIVISCGGSSGGNGGDNTQEDYQERDEQRQERIRDLERNSYRGTIANFNGKYSGFADLSINEGEFETRGEVRLEVKQYDEMGTEKISLLIEVDLGMVCDSENNCSSQFFSTELPDHDISGNDIIDLYYDGADVGDIGQFGFQFYRVNRVFKLIKLKSNKYLFYGKVPYGDEVLTGYGTISRQ